MRIAFISYEYPPDTAFGGIATYVQQAAQMLFERGHEVEVFASSLDRTETNLENGIIVHRVQEEDRFLFPKRIATIFAYRHFASPFDVLEGPDYNSDASEAIQLVRDIPLVVKLHTPTILLSMAEQTQTKYKKFKTYVGALRRGIKPYYYNYEDDTQRAHVLKADEIAAPSNAIAKRIEAIWKLQEVPLVCFPLPYKPSESMLRIPCKSAFNHITFLGKLSVLKGVYDFARAIPFVLNQCPDAKFRFVGSSSPEVLKQLQKLTKHNKDAIDFYGPVASDQISSVLAETDVCVFPSMWESFGFVCLEAMSAGRGIVASNSGGMAELLDFGAVGRLVPPRSPKLIAEEVIKLLKNPELRIQLGKSARERVLSHYNIDVVGAQQEASYKRAIKRRRELGARQY